MKLTPTTVLACLPIAVAVGVALGGAEGVGVLAGYLAGGAVGLFGYAWSQHCLRTRPELWMRASVGTFLVKLAGALLGYLALRYVDRMASFADWRAFLVAYVSVAYVSLIMGALDGRRLLRQEMVH